jgi:hypothetical protein
MRHQLLFSGLEMAGTDSERVLVGRLRTLSIRCILTIVCYRDMKERGALLKAY